jgi:hypothetical protein
LLSVVVEDYLFGFCQTCLVLDCSLLEKIQTAHVVEDVDPKIPPSAAPVEAIVLESMFAGCLNPATK